MTNLNFLLTQVLLPILQTHVGKFNTSFSLTVRHDRLQEGHVSLAWGKDDIFNEGSSIGLHSAFPVGSITKTVTTIRTMKLWEEGRFDIDQPIYELVDPLIMADNGTTLENIFHDSRVKNITARQIMGMQSGLPDYDDKAMMQWTYDNLPDRTPYDLLYEAAGIGLLCDPGTCGFYSTVGFNLLGLAIASVEGALTWLELDQHTFLPTDAPYKHEMIFPKLGPCTPYLKQGMVHQYALQKQKLNSSVLIDWFDLASTSCLNSWTGGNLAAPTRSLAGFIHDLGTYKLLKPSTLALMTKWHETEDEFIYGLGLMALDLGDSSASGMNISSPTYVFGHLGQDYGSGGFSMFSPKYNITLSGAVNSYKGMNCSVSDWKENRSPFFSLLCSAFKETIKTMFGESIDVCSTRMLTTVPSRFAVATDDLAFTGPYTCAWSKEYPGYAE